MKKSKLLQKAIFYQRDDKQQRVRLGEIFLKRNSLYVKGVTSKLRGELIQFIKRLVSNNKIVIGDA